MFLHMLRYRIKQIIRTKWLIGWTLLFPLILATAFNAGFGNLIRQDYQDRDPIPVTLITDQQNSIFTKVVDSLARETAKESDSNPLFELVQADSLDKARQLLKEGKVKGIFVEESEQDLRLEVSENGMDQTVLSEFLRTYQNNTELVTDIIRQAGDPDKVDLDKIKEILAADDALQKVTFKDDPVSSNMEYYYSLLAMASLFASWISSFLLSDIIANQSPRGLRFECSPASKLMAVVTSAFAGTAVQFVSNLLLVLYIEKVLGLSFHVPIGYILLVTTLGAAVGINCGIAISVLTNGNQNLCVAIGLAFTMICSFLSGLMVSSMRQIVETHIPLLNRINPSAVMADALYSAGTYGIGKRYWFNVLILMIMLILLTAFSGIKLARSNYDSI